MDETDDEVIGYLIANLMVFYKGAISYKELINMPIPELLELQKYAEKINREIENESRRRSK